VRLAFQQRKDSERGKRPTPHARTPLCTALYSHSHSSSPSIRLGRERVVWTLGWCLTSSEGRACCVFWPAKDERAQSGGSESRVRVRRPHWGRRREGAFPLAHRVGLLR